MTDREMDGDTGRERGGGERCAESDREKERGRGVQKVTERKRGRCMIRAKE